MVRLTDRPDMTLDVYRGRKTTIQYISYFSIMNSLVIVLFLSGMVAMIMLRTLHKDIARYNQMDNSVSYNPGPSWSKLTMLLVNILLKFQM